MFKPFRLALAVALIATIAQLHAQTSSAPQGINYQSVARDAAGNILTNQPVALQISIHDNGASGAIVFRERHVVVTNAFGTFSVVVGGGSIITGTLGGVNWGVSDKYMQVEMDFTGGTSYTNLGTSKLNSVPYALFSGGSAGEVTGVKYDTTGILNVLTPNNTISTIKGTWLAGGNGGLTTTNNNLGTTDNKDLVFIRGGKEAVRYTTGGAFLATGDAATGVTPASGAGKRMEWIPAKGAFREGSVTGTAWDNTNIGTGSTALGNDAKASGTNTVSIGNNTQALYPNSMAIGNNLITQAPNAMVIGMYNDTAAGSAGSIAPSDVIFQVGNGTATNRDNALTVSRTGQVVAPSLTARTLTLQTGSTLNLLGSTQINADNQSFIIVSSVGLPLLNTITLTPGSRPGQLLTIESQVLVPLFGVRVNDSGNINLSSSYFDMNNGDSLTLIWDGTSWVELTRSDN